MPLTNYAMPDTPQPATQPAGQGSDGAWTQTAGVRAETAADRALRDSYDRVREELRIARNERLGEISKGYARATDAYARGLDDGMKIADRAAEKMVGVMKDCASSRLPIDYIRGSAGQGYIYAVGFTTGTVKVGHTEDPKQRLGTHQNEALAYGVGITGYWISPPHFNYKTNEDELIKLCRAVSRRSRREYFHEIGLTKAIDLAWTLEFDSAIPDQLAYTCGFALS